MRLEDGQQDHAMRRAECSSRDALRDLLKARKALRKLSKPFEFKFRSKKDKLQTITIHAKHWQTGG